MFVRSRCQEFIFSNEVKMDWKIANIYRGVFKFGEKIEVIKANKNFLMASTTDCDGYKTLYYLYSLESK